MGAEIAREKKYLRMPGKNRGMSIGGNRIGRGELKRVYSMA